MRKIFLIAIAFSISTCLKAIDKMAFVMPVNPQDGRAYTYASTDAAGINKIPAFGAGDTITNLDRTWNFIVSPNLEQSYEYYFKLVLDSISGVVHMDTVALQGRMFNSEAWTDISVKTWYGHRTTGSATPDTVIYFNGLINPVETIIYDTTKIMNHTSPALKALYYANVKDVKTKYSQLRFHIHATTGTQRLKVVAAALKFLK